MADTSPAPLGSKRKYTMKEALIITGLAILLVVLGGGYIWSTRTLDAQVGDVALYSCDGQEEVIPMAMTFTEARRADIVSSSTYDSGAEAVTDVTLELRPSSTYGHDGFAITAGQLVVQGSPVGAFKVHAPGTMNAIRFNPAALNPPPNTELRLCLVRQ